MPYEQLDRILHARTSMVVLVAPPDLEENLLPGAEAPQYAGLRSVRRPPELLPVVGARDVFQATRLPAGFAGYTAQPVLVGDLMPWGHIIPGTGTWFLAWDQLQRRVMNKRNMELAVLEVREAIEMAWYEIGLRPGSRGEFGGP